MRALSLVLLAACRFSPAESGPDAAPDPVDAGLEDPPIDAAPLGPWGEPVLVAELGSPALDDDPTLTADLLEIYFASDRSLELTSEDIYVATRTTPTGVFSSPTKVEELSSVALDSNVEVAADGLTIMFTSERDGDADLYIATRPDRASPWGTPVLLAGVNSPSGEWGAVLSADQRRVVLCSDRGPSEAIFVATRASPDVAFTAPTKLVELDTSANECDAMLPEPRTMYFTRDSVATGIDILMATSADGITFGEPEEISELNTLGRDGDPWVSPDQRTLFMASDRAGVSSDDIYISTR